MKFILVVIAFIFARVAFATEDLISIRKTLEAAVKDSKTADEFYKSVKRIESEKPIIIGFKAMSELVLCKHVFSPISKLSHFHSGKNLLEKAIAIDPENAELRFYRYCTQLNVPGILNYSSNLKDDKEFLFEFIETQSKNPKKDLDLYSRIKKFLFTNKHATEEDKQKLKRF
ncbi:MAG: hypothetical protein IPG89_16440 [Bacteroidetes bacterium]|nr:hypothetical protein [Bacteroidota bacterium]